MSANFQPLEIADFSGGRTDAYIEGPQNRYQEADNLLIVRFGQIGKLISRPGSELYSSTYPLVNSAIERLGTIRNFRTSTTSDKLLIHSNKKLYWFDSGAGYTELTGPSSNKFLPSTASTSTIVTYAEWNNHIFFANDAFAPISKVYNDGSNNLKLRTAGLPALASKPVVTPTAATGHNYIYRFTYKYTYAVGTVTFIDESSVVEVSVTNSGIPNVNQNNITAIPVLSNSTTYNWDTANIKVEIYRTIDNGSEFFKIGEVTNGTTVFTDNFSDATIQASNILLYTEGGVVENDLPPAAKIVFSIGDFMYYAHIKDSSGQIFAYRCLQAIPGDPDSVPSDFFVDVGDEIIGGAGAKNFPILLCRNSVYRIDGAFDELGTGSMVATKISDTATCVSASSVVQTIDGVFWAGDDSYYFTDGYNVVKLCESWQDSYKLATASATQKKRIQGKYDSHARRIWWTIQQDSGGSSDCNACDILNLDWGISGESSFTSASGGTQFAPTAIEFVDGLLIRGDVNGYLLKHTATVTSDIKIDVLVTPANWVKKTIIWTYKSCAFNFGTRLVRKYVPKIILTCQNKSNISVQITSINDDGRKVENLKPIRFRGNFIWGDDTFVWGDPGFIWEFEGLIENQRFFPAKSLRCSFKQIQISNAFVVVANSDARGTVSISASTKHAALDNASVSDWPADSVDYFLAFQNDNYTNQFLVTARTADTLTYSDSANQSVTASGQKWELVGYPKGEILSLISFSMAFTPFGLTQTFFTAAEAGTPT